MNRRVRVLAAVSASATLMALLFLLSRSGIAIFDDRAFEAAAWQAARIASDRSVRARMVGSLRRMYLSTGMSILEIRSLLGPSDKTWNHADSGAPAGEEVLIYDMGRCRFDIVGQHYQLRLMVDQHGALVSHQVAID